MELSANETWKPVPGYEDVYSASNLGRLMRTATYGKIPKPRNRIITPHKKASGYCDYWLWKNGECLRIAAHRLIVQTFVGQIPVNLCVNHKNGIKDDNRLENLEVVTPSENTAHGFRALGRKAPNYPSPGERNGSAKLTEDKVREIRRLYAARAGDQYQLAEQFGVSQAAVGFIVRKKTWKHVSD